MLLYPLIQRIACVSFSSCTMPHPCHIQYNILVMYSTMCLSCTVSRPCNVQYNTLVLYSTTSLLCTEPHPYYVRTTSLTYTLQHPQHVLYNILDIYCTVCTYIQYHVVVKSRLLSFSMLFYVLLFQRKFWGHMTTGRRFTPVSYSLNG